MERAEAAGYVAFFNRTRCRRRAGNRPGNNARVIRVIRSTDVAECETLVKRVRGARSASRLLRTAVSARG
jgi:hypothetical protein